MNPLKLLQLKNLLAQFKQRHPKFPKFVKKISQEAVTPGSLFEFKVTTPEGKEYVSNIRLSQEDIDCIRELKELR